MNREVVDGRMVRAAAVAQSAQSHDERVLRWELFAIFLFVTAALLLVVQAA